MSLRLHILDKDPCIREVSKPIPEDQVTSPEMQEFYDQMIEAMEAADGIGIAATQVGRPMRVFVVTKEYAETDDHMVLVNPRFSSLSDKTFTLDQGCLSVPGVTGPVERPAKVRVKASFRDGTKADIKAKGMLAQILQHEMDHLDGVVFIDKASELSSQIPGVNVG